MDPVIDIENLTKRYDGKAVVGGISFSVQRGECFGLLGPNGAGKSTTLRMMIGLAPIDGGKLTVFGKPMHPEEVDIPRRLGVVPQEDNLDTDLTVIENLLIYAGFFGLSERKVRPRALELLDFVQLKDRAEARVRELSGGMKRRLVIARALIAEPEAVVLDEPTTGLDPQARHLIWQRLRALKEQGVTLILTTHYMEEAAQLCDRLLVLDHGKILDLGTPQELIERHVEPDVIEIRLNGSGETGEALLEGLSCRFELVGDTGYCYTDSPWDVMDRLKTRRDLVFLHRPASLEDVFLKLTGRELRD